MNVSAINSTNQKNFGQSGVEQLVKVADTISSSKQLLDADTIQNVADCIEVKSNSSKHLKHFLVSLGSAIAMYGTVKATSGRLFNYLDSNLNVPVFDYLGRYSKAAYDKVRQKVVPETARTFKAMVNNGMDSALKKVRAFAKNSVSEKALTNFKSLSPNGDVPAFYAKQAAMNALSSAAGAIAAIKSLKITTKDDNWNGTPDIFETDSSKKTEEPNAVKIAVQAANSLLPG